MIHFARFATIASLKNSKPKTLKTRIHSPTRISTTHLTPSLLSFLSSSKTLAISLILNFQPDPDSPTRMRLTPLSSSVLTSKTFILVGVGSSSWLTTMDTNLVFDSQMVILVIILLGRVWSNWSNSWLRMTRTGMGRLRRRKRRLRHCPRWRLPRRWWNQRWIINVLCVKMSLREEKKSKGCHVNMCFMRIV